MIHSSFENLEWGIRATTLDEINTFSVNNVDFTGNTYGLFAANTRNVSITNCNFFVSPEAYVPHPEDPADPYGAHLSVCNGYKIELNYFTSDDASEHRAGLVINNSNAFSFVTLERVEQNNRIYFNDFTNLYAATIAQGQNRTDAVPDEGLELLCGYYEGNVYDIAVTNQGKIALKQGNDQLDPFIPSLEIYPAGNLFMTNISGCTDQNALHVNNDSESFIYLYKQGSNSIPDVECYNQYRVYPATLPGQVEPREQECDNLSPTLPTHFAYRNRINQQLGTLEIVRSAINQLEDGGDSGALYAAINNLALSSQQLKNQLLPFCPNLSRGVLTAVMERQPHLDDYHLCEILLHCSPLPLDVWRDYMAQPLPAVLHELLEFYQTANENDLTRLYTLQKTARADKDLFKAEYGRFILYGQDEDLMQLEELKTASDLESTLFDERMKISIALQQRDFMQLADLLDLYLTDETKDAWHKVFEIWSEAKMNNQTFSEFPSSAINALEDIEQSGKSGAILASALLENLNGINRLDHTTVFPTGSTKSTRSHGTPAPKSPADKSLTCYPNPANQQLYVVIPPMYHSMTNLHLWITDLSGKSVHVEDASQSRGLLEVNIANLPVGQYTCQLVAAGKAIQSLQLQVVR